MSFTRRNFLVGAGSGLSLLLLTACTTPEPTPRPTSTPTPEPSTAVPEPAGFVRSSWSTDSFAMGSHSFVKVGTSPETRTALATALLDRLFFAGEATSTDHASTVLGARESGARAASEVAAASTPSERVAVVGAGAAGAEAARLLNFYGYDVVVIEARDRTGGRIHSVVDSDWPVPVELGAWMFNQSADEVILKQLEEVGVENAVVGPALYREADTSGADGSGPGATEGSASGSPDGSASDSPEADANDGSGDDAGDALPAVETNTVGLAALATALTWAAEQTRDFSLQEALDGSGATETASAQSLEDLDGAALLGQQLALVATQTGAAASDLSSWYGYPNSPEPTSATVIATGPVSDLIDDALDGIDVSLSSTVVGIAYSDDGVSLRLGTGESLNVDRAIVTVPLGVLQNDGIEFSPLLPFAHRSAISLLGFGTVDTVWLRFEEAFWAPTASVWNVVGADTEISTWINLQAITGDPVLVGVVGGAQATRLADFSDDEVREAAMISLAPFLDPA